MYSQITKKTKQLKSKIIQHRRYLHSIAETGFNTEKTSKYIYETLSSLGVECSYIEKNGVLGVLGTNFGEKTVLLRADIDALPIKEESGVEFSCSFGNMHGCGHDMHAAMLLGCAEVLSQMKENLKGEVRFLFQPAEEILSGAKKAIEEGVLDKVNYSMTVHVMTACDIPTGRILLSYDTPCAPSADFFEIKINGIGCHGSSPSIGVDPITCACRIVTALEHIKTHEIGIHDKAVLTIGEIHGGSSANAIPDEVTMRGTIRCFDEDVRKFYKKRFEEISNGIASAFRCKCEIRYTSGCPSLINNPELLDKTAKNLTELLGEEHVIKIKDTRTKIQGSEDFAYISQAVPSVSVAIAAGNRNNGFVFPLHNPKVKFDEDALEVGCNVFTYNAINLLSSEE